MPSKVSSKDVLLYLNEMGYTNINAQQLKEFMQDLKKLIKYEETKHLPHESTLPNDTKCSDLYTASESTILPASDPESETSVSCKIFSRLHKKGTVESNAKVVHKKENIVRIQIKRSKSSTLSSDQNKENQTQNAQPSTNVNKDFVDAKVFSSISEDNHPNTPVETKVVEKAPKTKPKPKHKKTVAFIRPTIQNSMKSDPVALYHRYKAEWKKVNFPGENNRDELRWAIREKMLRGPKTQRI